jgi:hypothetical protein
MVVRWIEPVTCLRGSKEGSWLQNKKNTTSVLIQSRKRSYKYLDKGTDLRDHRIEVVNKFVYLGSAFTSQNEELQEIWYWIQRANRVYFSILPQITCDISWRVWVMQYEALNLSNVQMVVRHGRLFLRKLSIWLTFERKILGKIFGPMQAKWVWRIRYNKEV